MKKLFTIVLAFALFFSANVSNAQSLEAQADKQTKEMAEKLRLNEAEYLKVKQFNLDRLEKIAALATLKEQDSRYLDLRLDQIEEEYQSGVYNVLNEKQFKAFASYKKDQPDTYAGVINQNSVLRSNAIAVATEE